MSQGSFGFDGVVEWDVSWGLSIGLAVLGHAEAGFVSVWPRRGAHA